MKSIGMKKLGFAAALAAGMSFAGIALAEEKANDGAQEHEWHQKMLLKFDTNKDGKLDDTEREAMREQRHAKFEEKRQEMVQKYDANGDGKLEPAERQKMRDDFAVARFQKLDANKDGSVTLDEFRAAFARHHGFGQRFGRGFGGFGGHDHD